MRTSFDWLIEKLRDNKTAWLLTFSACCVIYAAMARSCGNDHLSVIKYLAYLLFLVWLPGLLVLRVVSKRALGAVEAVALGMPIGFAIEISMFFALSAIGARNTYPLSSILYIILSAGVFRKDFLTNLTGFLNLNPWHLFGFSLILLATVATAASQLFIQAPLYQGAMAQMTHHDWVYLISRAAEIKQQWPVGEPSMSGASLNYHYFLMIHIAAASSVTGNEVSMLLLRCYVAPLTLTLVMQGYMLGRSLTNRALGGFLTIVLMLLAEEVSFLTSSQSATFYNLFVRFLYLSPTFFFGMIFSGAILLWIWRIMLKPIQAKDIIILIILAAAGTGSKATVLPPIMLSLGVLTVFSFFKFKSIVPRLILITCALTFSLGIIYIFILAQWGSGAATLKPWATIWLSRFWIDNLTPWTAALVKIGIPDKASQYIAEVFCALIVILGGLGVRALGVLYILNEKQNSKSLHALWLGLVWAATLLSGHFIALDSEAHLYLLYSGNLAIAALAATALIKYGNNLIEKTKLSKQVLCIIITCFTAVVLINYVVAKSFSLWVIGALYLFILITFTPGKSILNNIKNINRSTLSYYYTKTKVSLSAMVQLYLIIIIFFIQLNHWRLRNQDGLLLWLKNPPENHTETSMELLHEAMLWLRKNAESNAVIVANAFTPKNINEKLAVIDDTTVDKYYYYSALSEHRLWVEGPAYLRNQNEADKRMSLAARVFYGGAAPKTLGITQPYYILVDKYLKDKSLTEFPGAASVFENKRLIILRNLN